jgi:predicted metalloprotease with PDZ domain
MTRTGLTTATDFAATNGMVLNTVINSPARRDRSAEDMSRLAPFTDGASWVDRTNWDNRVISYYTWGAAIALALDLSLRDRTGDKVTLDDFMRALWRQFGRLPPPAEGVVAHPYTMQDLKNVLGQVADDRAFAEQFFAKYIQGREVADYQTLLARAGFVLRKRSPQRAWIGPVALRVIRGSAVITAPTWEGTPAYTSGLDQDDEIVSFDGEMLSSAEHIDEIVQRHKSGDKIRVVVRRHGVSEPLTMTVESDPTLEMLPAESSGRSLSAQERVFRDAWLTSKQ